MRVSSQAIALWSLLASTDGFAPSVSFVKKTALFGAKNLHEFDYLLGEHSGNQQPVARSRRGLFPIENGKQQLRLTSAVMEAEAAVSEESLYDGYTEEDFLEDEYSEQVGKITTFEEKKATNGALEWVKQADLQEILWTVAVPAVVVAIGVQFLTKKASAKMEGNADELLESFATEMMYYDGDFEEMKMVQKDYGTRLLWLGPKKNDIMLKKYLETYAKKKTVTPKAIRYVRDNEKSSCRLFSIMYSSVSKSLTLHIPSLDTCIVPCPMSFRSLVSQRKRLPTRWCLCANN